MTLSVAEEWIAHLLPVWETLDSDIAMGTGYFNLIFSWFSSVFFHMSIARIHRINQRSLPSKYFQIHNSPDEEVLLRVNEQRNILREIRKRKANWIGHILRRNCLLKQVIEVKIKREIEVTRKRGRRRKKLLDELKDGRGYTHLNEEDLDRTMWRNRFGTDVGPVVRQITE
jgi:hypothetical protein